MERKPLPIRWLIEIPLWSSTVLGGLTISSILYAKDWDLFDWQGLLATLVILVFLIGFVMTPLLIVKQELER